MIQTICICGAGTMGSGIAQSVAMGGFRTLLYDLNPDMLRKAAGAIEKSLGTLKEKHKISLEEMQACLDRIRYISEAGDCIADLIIEAIVERPEAKLELFRLLAPINKPATILATNTSSLSITALAEKLPHPERVAGMHFFNPTPVMKLVEVVRTELTSELTTKTIMETVIRMGKTPVLCKDSPGFIVNRVARPYYLEALRLVEQGMSDIESIDTLMEAAGFKMGPFRLMDLIGNDVNYAVSCSVYEAMGRPIRLQPSPIQAKKVRNGELGRKSGRGYYDY
ncbi:MAG TPA: 3-hydroxyacyl-CoA dehydrogenase NAD-binding domain-containing protein [Puia sp.]|nr:3-hydroxyacyl-CoA dehydrogenase NAD-binding domain-containing protein [Puia sp.]